MTNVPTAGAVADTVVARSVEALPALRDEWLAIRAEHGMATPNADPDRFLATLQEPDGNLTPYVALFRGEDKPAALLVGRIAKRRGVARFGYAKIPMPVLTTLEVVYGGLITDGSPESAERVLAHLRRLFRENHVDNMLINSLPVEHDLWEPLRSGSAGLGRPVMRKILHWETRLFDKDSGERIHHGSSRTRATWRRKDRKLQKAFDGEISVEVIREPDQVAEFLTAADSITAQTYHGAIGVGLRDTPTWRSILEAMARNGNLRSYLLKGRSQPLAYVGGSVYGEAFNLEVSAFSPEYRHLSPGTVLMNRVFDDLSGSGVPYCDFGFGDAEYKRLNGTNSWVEGTLHCYGRRLRARLAFGMDGCALAATVAAKRVMASAGAFNRVRSAWRKNLERR